MSTEIVKKRCDMCKIETNTESDTIYFGEWMTQSNIQVHYFCLLTATNLPQNGRDFNGILGFLLRDIRNEIKSAEKRNCCYCGQAYATIECQKCHVYFHLVCGERENCLFHFIGAFPAFCDNCIPLTPNQEKLLQTPPPTKQRCQICFDIMGVYQPIRWIYGICCGNGFVHRSCMQSYALNAGYYLRCIWCRSTSFRDYVRLQGVFVPDRDANWERQQGAYMDLHRGHERCDMHSCLCPQGRDFNSPKWNLTNCCMCGSFGVHNPICILQLSSKQRSSPVEQFKCFICREIENTIVSTKTTTKTNTTVSNEVPQHDTSVFMPKSTINNNNNTVIPENLETQETQSHMDDIQSTSINRDTVIPENLETQETQSHMDDIQSTSINREIINTQETNIEPTIEPEINANKEMDIVDSILKIKHYKEEMLEKYEKKRYWLFERDKDGNIECKETIDLLVSAHGSDDSDESDKEIDFESIDECKIVTRSNYTGYFQLMDESIKK